MPGWCAWRRRRCCRALTTSGTGCAPRYRALVGAHGLIDAFRHLHPHDAEYSWVGRTGDGYRYDHAFCSHSLLGLITACSYLHQPREEKLSDHSALTVRFGFTPPEALLTSDPVTAIAPPTLF